MGARTVLVNGLIALAGGVGLFYAAEPIERHAERLLRHLDSGSWETVSDRPYQESVIRRTYDSQAGQWVVSFVAARGSSLLLDEEHRSQTIRLVGHRSLGDPETLRFHDTEVFHAYRLFLAEAIAETAVKVVQQDRGALERLARALRQARPNLKDAKERAKFDSVRRVLAASSTFEQLGRALQVYQDYEVQFSGGPFDQFQVFTDPPYDVTALWNSRSTELPSQGRCLGKAYSYAAAASAVAVDFTLAPRLLEVTLVRPWLSDQVLDEFATAQREASRHFGEGGDLGIIPSRLWVLMPERVRLKGVSESDQETLENWAKQDTCCRLVCDAVEVTLDKSSLRFGNDKRLAALRSDARPLLYAIASRRRVPQ